MSFIISVSTLIFVTIIYIVLILYIINKTRNTFQESDIDKQLKELKNLRKEFEKQRRQMKGSVK